MAKLPYMQFYTGDWMKDQAVRASSLAARGLWFDLLCFMWESPERGYLKTPGGAPMTADHISRMVGASPKDVKTLLEELRSNGVFDEQAGCIINRRMVRASGLSGVRSDAAKERWRQEQRRKVAQELAMQNGVQPSDAEIDAAISASEFRNQNSAAAAAAFPEFAAAARMNFPAVDDALLAELIELAKAEFSAITDAELSAVIKAATKPNQRSAALWRKTIPEVIRSWKKSS